MRSRLFDSLKGIAIIGIFMIHAGVNTGILQNEWRTLFRCGAYGVEITYLINAFFLSKKFDSRSIVSKKESFLFSLENLFRVMPLYYFFLTIYVINIGITNINIFETISHYLFLNAVNPDWFTSIYDAAGYMGILALMWFIYPFYLRYIQTIRKAVIGAAGSIVLFRLLSYALMLTTDYNTITDTQYFCRGLMSFSIGHLLYLVLKNRQYLFSVSERWIFSLLIILGFLALVILGKVTSAWLLVLTSLLIVVNFNKSVWLIDNMVFAYVGKLIFPIYLVHMFLLTFFFPKLERSIWSVGIIAMVTLGMAIILNPLNNVVSDFMKKKLFGIKRGGKNATAL